MASDGADEGRKRKATQALLDRNAEIIAVLSELVKARCGGEPSPAEGALAREAYDNLLSLSLSTTPKALAGPSKRLKTFVHTTRNLGILPLLSDQPPRERPQHVGMHPQRLQQTQQLASVQAHVSARDPRAQQQAAPLGLAAPRLTSQLAGGLHAGLAQPPLGLAGQGRGISSLNVLQSATAGTSNPNAVAPAPPFFSFSAKAPAPLKAPDPLAHILSSANQQVVAASSPSVNPLQIGQQQAYPWTSVEPSGTSTLGPIRIPLSTESLPVYADVAQGPPGGGVAAETSRARVAVHPSQQEGRQALGGLPSVAALSVVNPAALQAISNPFENSAVLKPTVVAVRRESASESAASRAPISQPAAAPTKPSAKTGPSAQSADAPSIAPSTVPTPQDARAVQQKTGGDNVGGILLEDRTASMASDSARPEDAEQDGGNERGGRGGISGGEPGGQDGGEPWVVIRDVGGSEQLDQVTGPEDEIWPGFHLDASEEFSADELTAAFKSMLSGAEHKLDSWM